MRVPRPKYSKHTEQRLKRKNFLPTLLITILLWIMLGGLIYFVEPSTFGAVPLFFVTTFTVLLFTSSLLFANSRRGLVITMGLTFFLLLSYLGVGNILNLILIVAITTCIELYFSLKWIHHLNDNFSGLLFRWWTISKIKRKLRIS